MVQKVVSRGNVREHVPDVRRFTCAQIQVLIHQVVTISRSLCLVGTLVLNIVSTGKTNNYYSLLVKA
jgi:hypothetical protein